VKEVKRVYSAIANYFQIPVGAGNGMSYSFEIDQFSETYMLEPYNVYNSLKVLELQGLINFNDSVELSSRIHFLLKHDELYDFQLRNIRFDHLIKTILRSYEGLFRDFSDIHEGTLAQRAGMKTEDLVIMLQQLDQFKVLSYIPSTDKPQISFMTERLDERDIRIDRHVLAERKERQMNRVKAMIHFISDKQQCWSRMLLAYFDEIKDQRCGVCDYCIGRNKLAISDMEFEQMMLQVKSILMTNPLPVQELAQRISPSTGIADSNHNIKVIEWLLDNEKIIYQEGDYLKWVE
jgi:ATP-dependent DNA helicase RecQ